MSSAHEKILFYKLFHISSVNNINKSDPRTLSYETPDTTGQNWINSPSTVTRFFQLVKNFFKNI